MSDDDYSDDWCTACRVDHPCHCDELAEDLVDDLFSQ